MKVFNSFDVCVAYLEDLGCSWCYEYEKKFRKQKWFEFAGVIVFWDKFNILN